MRIIPWEKDSAEKYGEKPLSEIDKFWSPLNDFSLNYKSLLKDRYATYQMGIYVCLVKEIKHLQSNIKSGL